MNERKTKTFSDDSTDLRFFEKSTKAIQKDEKKIIEEVAKESNFSSRGDLKKNPQKQKRSPYVLQKNIKMRVGMFELLETLAGRVNAKSVQETIEMSIGALVEKTNDIDLKKSYNELVK